MADDSQTGDLQPSDATWRCLSKSRNVAAIATLVDGLTNLKGENRTRCAAALASRRESEAQAAIIRAWKGFDGESVARLGTGAGRLAEAAKGILTAGAREEQLAALRVVSDLCLGEAMEAVVAIVVKPGHPVWKEAVDCMMHLCRKYGQQARLHKDATRERSQMMNAILYQIDLFHENRCGELIDAWLVGVHWDDSTHRRLIGNPMHAAYRQIIMRMKCSKAPEVMQLLAGYLTRCRTAPRTVVETLVGRNDPKLAIHIAQLLDDQSMVTALSSLRRLKPLACLSRIGAEIDELAPGLQRRLWLMISASSEDLSLVLRGALSLSKCEDPEDTEVAAAMIRGCRRPDPEALVSSIQNALANPLETQSLGLQLMELTGWLDSENKSLKSAAQQFFKEFTIDGLVDAVRMWPAQMCRAMARIVRKLESDYPETLKRGMQSPAPRRRLAALEVVQLMDVADEMADVLVELLDDPKVEVRVQAIDLLSAIGHRSIASQIDLLLKDASSDIQEAAERAQRKSGGQRVEFAVSGE